MPAVAVSSYSFHRLVKTGRAALEDTPRLAREAGADAIEFALGGSLSPPLDPDFVARLRAAAERAGLPIDGVCIAGEILRPTDAPPLPDQAALALEFGAPRLRHDLSFGPPDGDLSDAAFERALPRLADAARRIARLGAARHVRTSVENHGRFLQHHDRLRALVERVDHPNFGLTLDLGNLLFAAQDPLQAVRALAPFAHAVHLKDFSIDPPDADPAHLWPTYDGGPPVLAVPLGEGDLPLPELIAALREADFQGPWVLEHESPLGDPLAAIPRALATLRRLLDA